VRESIYVIKDNLLALLPLLAVNQCYAYA